MAANRVTAQLTDRIVTSAFAMERLPLLVQSVVRDYGKRFGALKVEAADPRPAQ